MGRTEMVILSGEEKGEKGKISIKSVGIDVWNIS